jgi:hypothetical protein
MQTQFRYLSETEKERIHRSPDARTLPALIFGRTLGRKAARGLWIDASGSDWAGIRGEATVNTGAVRRA